MTPEELKKLINDLGTTFEDYKKSNDEAIVQMKASGSVDTLLEEKLAKMDTAMSEMQTKVTNAEAGERLDDLEAQLNRLDLSGGGAGGSQIITPDMKEYKEAFNTYLRKGAGEHELEALARKALISTDSDPDGGFVVLPEIDQEISRVQSNLSAMRSISRVQPIGAQSWEKIVTISGANAGWVAEREARTKTTSPILSKITIEAMEMYAEPAATQIALDDQFINTEMWLAEEVAIGFDETEGAAFVTGDGNKKPRGFLDYDTVANASYAWGSLGFVKTGVNGAFPAAGSGSADPLIDLVFALRAARRNNGSFIMDNLTQAVVRKLKDENDNYYWQPSLQAGQPALLLGYPVAEDDNMPAIATDSFSIAFGDFNRGYTIVDRMGVRTLRDPYTEKGKILFYTTKRVGGGVTDFEAIKLLKFSS